MTGGVQATLVRSSLPIDAVMPKVLSALEKHNEAVVIAAPGAGKTTRIPLAMLETGWVGEEKILVLQPRRLAAKSTAFHVAGLLGEKPGETVGYRVRHEAKSSSKTCIEYITAGIFTRMILDDPELTGIAAVIFDEFHERSIDSDFGLALAIDARRAFRPDLKLLPMSATLNGHQIAKLLDGAPVIECQGRSFPVEVRHQPLKTNENMDEAMMKAIRSSLATHNGSLLCFLPGQGEIRRLSNRLEEGGFLPQNTSVHLLYGALEPAAQSAAIAPPQPGQRKVILATAIAETSITIDGVTTVIDSGLARVARFDPITNSTRLETVKASKASVTQRAGRAGRTAPGTAIRLWHEGQTTALPEYETPEILESDLSSLVLDLAEWGVQDPNELSWLDCPPATRLAAANQALQALGALDQNAALTTLGRAIRQLPIAPPLAKMLLISAKSPLLEQASQLAALISEPGLGGNSANMEDRLFSLKLKQNKHSSRGVAFAARLARQAKNLVAKAGLTFAALREDISPGGLLSLAYPDRIGKNTGPADNSMTAFKLANGRQVRIEASNQLAQSPFLIVTEMQGTASKARILSAATLTLEEIQSLHNHTIDQKRDILLDQKTGKLRAIQTTNIGALELSKQNVQLKTSDRLEEALITTAQQTGLYKTVPAFRDAKVSHLIQRLQFAHSYLPELFPPMDEATMSASLENWLLPVITGVRAFSDITAAKITDGLYYYVGQEAMGLIDQIAPKTWLLPTGNRHNLIYRQEAEIVLCARVQEFYSLKSHPQIESHLLKEPIIITLELLSPAMRPIQKTRDLPGFWAGSWADVKKEMHGRYPKHLWPDEPANTEATTRTKRKS